MSVQPIRDNIVVSREEGTKTTSSGLHLVTIEEKNITGLVVAVGSGRVTMNGQIVPLDVKEGDRVVFAKSMAIEVKDGDATFLVLREDSVLCVLR